MGLLRRESGLSIASLVPEREKPKEQGEGQREVVEVSSRPGSIRSNYVNEEDAGPDRRRRRVKRARRMRRVSWKRSVMNRRNLRTTREVFGVLRAP